MPFYVYHQNNSGGKFAPPAINLVVEADTPAEADTIALSEGVYEDDGSDCQCCGSRWYLQGNYPDEHATFEDAKDRCGNEKFYKMMGEGVQFIKLISK